MRKMKTANTDKVLRHPNGNPEQSLPYRQGVGAEGEFIYLTYWRPSIEELRRIKLGDAIELRVHSPSHPPVSIGVSDEREVD